MNRRDEMQAILDDERRRASDQIAALEQDLDTIIDSSLAAPPDDEHDPEGASIGFERAQVASLLSRARSRLTEIDRAGERLETGAYGACEQCGRVIGVERLRAHPTAATCVSCAGNLGVGVRRGVRS